LASDAPLFVSERQRRLSYPAAAQSWAKACTKAGILGRVRLHDLRHSFAVQSVSSWYATRQDPNVLLPVLSTYLGHVSLENSRTYLRANGLLLESASRLFQASTSCLDEVRS
jgi:integrase